MPSHTYYKYNYKYPLIQSTKIVNWINTTRKSKQDLLSWLRDKKRTFKMWQIMCLKNTFFGLTLFPLVFGLPNSQLPTNYQATSLTACSLSMNLCLNTITGTDWEPSIHTLNRSPVRVLYRITSLNLNWTVVYLCINFVSMHSFFALPGWRHECSLKQMRVSHFGLIFWCTRQVRR